MTTDFDAISDHSDKSREFLARAQGYLRDGDLHQASEKGWGAASHVAKAAAEAMNMRYERHEDFRRVVREAGRRLGEHRHLVQLARSAESLHSNYYQRTIFLDVSEIEADLEDVLEYMRLMEPIYR